MDLMVPIRKGDANNWAGAFLRGQRFAAHVLVNMRQGNVAFGRQHDLQNVKAYEEILQRHELGLVQARDILKPESYEFMRPLIESVDWVALGIREEDLNPNGLELVSQKLTLETINEIENKKPKAPNPLA
jgi:hypothetical protein